MTPKLRVFRPDGTHADHALGDRFTIGRTSDNACVLADERASGAHAVIEVTRSGKVQVRDLGSTNGTRVNGSATSGAVIAPGDVVEIGDHRLVLWAGDEAPAAPARRDAGHAFTLLPKAGGPAFLVPPRATVGRSPDRELSLDHDTVSAQHAVLTHTADGLAVEDSGSSNGTWVDGTRVRRAALAHGQVVAFGQIAFVVQRGGREVLALTTARRRAVAGLALLGVLALGGGLLAVRALQPPPADATRPHPPTPTPIPTPPATGPRAVTRGALRLTLDADGAFALARDGRPVIADGRVVILADDGAVRGRQGDRSHVPKDGIAVERSGQSALGYVWVSATEGYPFALSAGVTPRGDVAVAGSVGAAGKPVIGGLRLDLAPGVTVAGVRAPDGSVTTPTGPFDVPDADELTLSDAQALLTEGGPRRSASRREDAGATPVGGAVGGREAQADLPSPLTMRFSRGWGLRGRLGPGGWQLLAWRRSDTALVFDWVFGGRSRADEAALAALQAAAERAGLARDHAAAVAAWRELLHRIGDDDPDAPRVRDQLDAARRLAGDSGR